MPTMYIKVVVFRNSNLVQLINNDINNFKTSLYETKFVYTTLRRCNVWAGEQVFVKYQLVAVPVCPDGRSPRRRRARPCRENIVMVAGRDEPRAPSRCGPPAPLCVSPRSVPSAAVLPPCRYNATPPASIAPGPRVPAPPTAPTCSGLPFNFLPKYQLKRLTRSDFQDTLHTRPPERYVTSARPRCGGRPSRATDCRRGREIQETNASRGCFTSRRYRNRDIELVLRHGCTYLFDERQQGSLDGVRADQGVRERGPAAGRHVCWLPRH